MRNLIVAVGIVALVAACATVEQVPMVAGTRSAMQGKTVVRTTRVAKPDFSAFTPGKAAFAVIGAFAAISAGNELVKANNVQVPDDAIGKALGAQLQAVRGMRLIDAPITVSSNDIAQITSAASGKADYVLDIQTVGWNFIYFSTSWNHYQVKHQANARIIDVATKKIVAQGMCRRNPGYSDNAPTYDQLVNNQAAGLKTELDLAAKECIATLEHELLAI